MTHMIVIVWVWKGKASRFSMPCERLWLRAMFRLCPGVMPLQISNSWMKLQRVALSWTFGQGADRGVASDEAYLLCVFVTIDGHDAVALCARCVAMTESADFFTAELQGTGRRSWHLTLSGEEDCDYISLHLFKSRCNYVVVGLYLRRRALVQVIATSADPASCARRPACTLLSND